LNAGAGLMAGDCESLAGLPLNSPRAVQQDSTSNVARPRPWAVWKTPINSPRPRSFRSGNLTWMALSGPLAVARARWCVPTGARIAPDY